MDQDIDMSGPNMSIYNTPSVSNTAILSPSPTAIIPWCQTPPVQSEKQFKKENDHIKVEQNMIKHEQSQQTSVISTKNEKIKKKKKYKLNNKQMM